MEYTFRMGTPEDYPALVKFWCDNSGWDIIDQQAWESRFVHTPEGVAALSLAFEKDTDDIVGQFFFIPSKVTVGDKYIVGYRPFAPIMKESIRNQGVKVLQEMIFQLYLQAVGSISFKGASLIHMVPDPRWLRLLRNLPIFQFADFPLYSLKLPVLEPFELPEGYSIENIEYTDPRIDALWQKARLLYKAMISRDSPSLAWKNSHKAYILRGVSFESKLIGLYVWIARHDDKQCLICDVLSEDGDKSLEITLKAAAISANQYVLSLNESDKNIEKVAVLTTPLMKPHLKNLGFYKDNYTFPLLVHLFDTNITHEEVAAENWYTSAND